MNKKWVGGAVVAVLGGLLVTDLMGSDVRQLEIAYKNAYGESTSCTEKRIDGQRFVRCRASDLWEITDRDDFSEGLTFRPRNGKASSAFDRITTVKQNNVDANFAQDYSNQLNAGQILEHFKS